MHFEIAGQEMAKIKIRFRSVMIRTLAVLAWVYVLVLLALMAVSTVQPRWTVDDNSASNVDFILWVSVPLIMSTLVFQLIIWVGSFFYKPAINADGSLDMRNRDNRALAGLTTFKGITLNNQQLALILVLIVAFFYFIVGPIVESINKFLIPFAEDYARPILKSSWPLLFFALYVLIAAVFTAIYFLSVKPRHSHQLMQLLEGKDPAGLDEGLKHLYALFDSDPPSRFQAAELLKKIQKSDLGGTEKKIFKSSYEIHRLYDFNDRGILANNLQASLLRRQFEKRKSLVDPSLEPGFQNLYRELRGEMKRNFSLVQMRKSFAWFRWIMVINIGFLSVYAFVFFGDSALRSIASEPLNLSAYLTLLITVLMVSPFFGFIVNTFLPNQIILNRKRLPLLDRLAELWLEFMFLLSWPFLLIDRGIRFIRSRVRPRA